MFTLFRYAFPNQTTEHKLRKHNYFLTIFDIFKLVFWNFLDREQKEI